MKKFFETEIKSNVEVAEKIFRLEVAAREISEISKAGQFVTIKLPAEEFTLNRPFGIAGLDGGILKMFYRVVGRGTKFLSTLKPGEKLKILAPLGNGFTFDPDEKILLVGGGMGLAPLLAAAGQADFADVLIGGKNSEEVKFWISEFKAAADEIFVTTDDGSFGKHGFVTDFLPEILVRKNYSRVLTCGPEIMMRGVAKISGEYELPCLVSFEKRMACGLGACLSCSTDTKSGRKKICKDGPVFDSREVF